MVYRRVKTEVQVKLQSFRYRYKDCEDSCGHLTGYFSC